MVSEGKGKTGSVTGSKDVSYTTMFFFSIFLHGESMRVIKLAHKYHYWPDPLPFIYISPYKANSIFVPVEYCLLA